MSGSPRRLLLLAFILLAAASVAGAEPTHVVYLSGADKDHTVDWEFMVNGGRRASQWTTIPVPSQWELQGFGTYNYGQEKNRASETGHYRHRFDVPAAWRGRRVVIVFEGSMTDTDVRVNGKPAGPTHQGGFYEFRYDISRLLRYGASNLLEVTVAKESSNESVNRAERDADYWVFGGIFRPVYLAVSPAQSLERVAIDARADGAFTVDVVPHGVTTLGRILAQVETLEGQPVGSPFSASVLRGQPSVRLSARFDSPAAWNAEHPYLYRLVVRLEQNGRTVHEIRERFGFRTIEVRPRDGIYVNGTRVVLKGVNRHSAWPDSGRTTSRALSLADVQLMKDMNMNAVRMSHYPPDKHFLEACDELGLYVLNELAGWQAAYDSVVGRALVRALVIRDVNHPSILFWNNGNEGGWNTDLDGEFARWDPQGRVVLHPWDTFGGIDTTHYLPYACCAQQFFNGRELIMPTEFLHGLYDGGHGAALREYWDAIERSPLGAGGFLWVFADEGVVRTDKDGTVDVHHNFAPDGIVGPYREKEASFYAIKRLWSPVVIDRPHLAPTFDGRLRVENRYAFTNLDQVRFRWDLIDFPTPADDGTGHRVMASSAPPAPSVPPGEAGWLALDLPPTWRERDALSLTAEDHTRRELYTWRWMLRTPAAIAARAVGWEAAAVAPPDPAALGAPDAREDGSRLVIRAGFTTFSFDRGTGRLAEVTRDGSRVSFANGPRLVAGTPGGPAHPEPKVREVAHHGEVLTHVVQVTHDEVPFTLTWTVYPTGWLALEYRYRVRGGEHAHLGITFDYPEAQVTSMRWLGRGPYRVWKNRQDGVEFDVWQKTANDTQTGASWEYPEFRGHHADFQWAVIDTTEVPITIVSGTEGLFLRLLTPSFPADARHAAVAFPEGNISVLHAIPAIGTKFHPASALGPASRPNQVNNRTGVYEGRLWFFFGEPPSEPSLTPD
jgi:hypothetical protein